jgi:transcriptional regulator with XRE-family HTH domain/uncharacterized protein YktA (UPF0223 family)
MAAKKRNHPQPRHTPEDRARHKAIREKLNGRPTPEELVESGEYEPPVPHGLVLDTMRLLGQLRATRQATGMSLAALAKASGIDKPALSRLETGRQDNPTLLTLLRYAHALGKRLVWTLEDEPVDVEQTRTVGGAGDAAASAEAMGGGQKTGQSPATSARGPETASPPRVKDAMNRPSLFDFATSELSQDAILCWLLSWADRQYREADEALHKTALTLLHQLLTLHRIDPPAECQSQEIRRPYKDLDILVLVNDDIALLIEDKIDTSEHSDQLRRYLQIVRQDFPDRKLAPVFLKTGDQSNYGAVKTAGYARFGRRDLLDVLEDGEQRGVTNAIFRDYLCRLRRVEELSRSWDRVPARKWGRDRTRWAGFFMLLQERLGAGEWKYVPTPSGGFMGFHWHWRPQMGNTFRRFLQLEEDHLCFKIQVEVKAEQKARWEEWHAAIMAESRSSGLNLRRPARRGKGTWMTVAVLDGDYRQVDDGGLLDLDRTVSFLKQAEHLLDSAVARTQHPPAS